MTKCTVVVSTYKRSIHLDRCLQSVLPLHPEIIVVSSGFDSETITVAKSYKATLIERPNSLMLNVNKNYGFSKVKTDWILNLDDDEELTEELIREIKKFLRPILHLLTDIGFLVKTSSLENGYVMGYGGQMYNFGYFEKEKEDF